MKFQNLKYWRGKASHYSPETRLFVNGEYYAAADDEASTTLDPVGQRPLAKVARGKKADVDRVVTAARTVFEHGDWSQASPAECKAALHKLADLTEQYYRELAPLETPNTGKPIRYSLRNDTPGAARAIRWYVETIDKAYGEVATTSVDDPALIVREPVGVTAAIVP